MLYRNADLNSVVRASIMRLLVSAAMAMPLAMKANGIVPPAPFLLITVHLTWGFYNYELTCPGHVGTDVTLGKWKVES